LDRLILHCGGRCRRQYALEVIGRRQFFSEEQKTDSTGTVKKTLKFGVGV